MKNRSKILSPRATQIRRELSNSAEFAATGFSSIFSNTKSQLKKVFSKISGVCSTALNLFFQNPEISYQSRELYLFNSKLDSISNTIKDQISSPKPLYLDSYTMPPTPGRFLISDEESNNKKEKSFKPELKVEIIKRPEYGIPVWRQLGSMGKEELENNLREEGKTGNNRKQIEVTLGTFGTLRTLGAGDTAGSCSAGEKQVRENPNSTPMKGMSDDVRHPESDPGRETPAFGKGIVEWNNSEDKDREKEMGKDQLKGKEKDQGKIILNDYGGKVYQGGSDEIGNRKGLERDLDTFSFMDKNEIRDLDLPDEHEDVTGMGNKASGRMNVNRNRNEDPRGVRVKIVKVFQQESKKSEVLDGVGKTVVDGGDKGKVGMSADGKISFIENEVEKKEVRVLGFVDKASRNLEILESGTNENQPTIHIKKTESINPKQKTLNNPLKNPFATDPAPILSQKQDYIFPSTSNPFSSRLNPPISNPETSPSAINLTKLSPEVKETSTKSDTNLFNSSDKLHSKSNSDGKMNQFYHSNLCLSNSSASSSEAKPPNPESQNPFIDIPNPFTSIQDKTTSSISKTSKEIKNSSILSNSNESSCSSSSNRNPLTSSSQNSSSLNKKSSTSTLIPTIKQVRILKNNENLEYPYNDELVAKTNSRVGVCSKNELMKIDDKRKFLNPFVVSGTNENKKDGTETKDFNIGILPKRDNSGVLRNFK